MKKYTGCPIYTFVLLKYNLDFKYQYGLFYLWTNSNRTEKTEAEIWVFLSQKTSETTQQDFAMLLCLDKKANKLWDQIRMWDGPISFKKMK